MKDDCIICLYTDDCLVFGTTQKTIDTVFEHLKARFQVEIIGDIKDFLGVDVHIDTKTHPTKKTITLTQPGLTETIITDLGLKPTSKPTPTPATTVLHPDKNGERRLDT